MIRWMSITKGGRWRRTTTIRIGNHLSVLWLRWWRGAVCSIWIGLQLRRHQSIRVWVTRRWLLLLLLRWWWQAVCHSLGLLFRSRLTPRVRVCVLVGLGWRHGIGYGRNGTKRTGVTWFDRRQTVRIRCTTTKRILRWRRGSIWIVNSRGKGRTIRRRWRRRQPIWIRLHWCTIRISIGRRRSTVRIHVLRRRRNAI